MSSELVEVDSSGLASQYQGMCLGQYCRLQADTEGAPCYAQAHTGTGRPCYIYRRDGAWHIDQQRGSVRGALCALVVT